MKAKLNSPLKKLLFGLAIAVVVTGMVWGGMTLLRNARRQAVNVYSVADFVTYDYGSSGAESSGMVTTDKLQKIYISDSQTVKVVYVTEGQTVRKGDKLLSYDTTLGDLDLKRAEIDLARQKLALDAAQSEIDLLKKAKNKEELTAEKTKLEAELAEAQSVHRGSPTDACKPYVPTTEADGTAEKPYYVKASGTDITREMIANLQEGYTVIYHEIDETPVAVTGILLENEVITFFDAEMPIKDDPAEGQDNVAAIQKKLNQVLLLLDASLSQSDLTKEINEKTIALNTAKVDYKLAEINLQSKKKEASSNIVYSEVTGTVKAVRDATEAYQNNQPVVEVSGGGGYYITGSFSEMLLGTIRTGQTVSIYSWQTGASCEGKIVSVETYPTSSTGWSNGNNNVSWYPFKVFVDEDADLMEGDYVDITYQSGGTDSSNTWFLENPFIRTESGKSYVMVRGDDGRLEQRFLQTGRDLWGSYTEICGGLTQEEYIAFPYGKDTVAGAKTREATPDELYNY